MEDQQEIQQEKLQPVREGDVERAMLDMESRAIYASVEKIRAWLKNDIHNSSSPKIVLGYQQDIKARRKMEAEAAAKTLVPPAEPLPEELAGVLSAGQAAIAESMASLEGALQSAISGIRTNIYLETNGVVVAVQADADARIEAADAEAQDSSAAVERLEWELCEMAASRDMIAADLGRTREELAVAHSLVGELKTTLSVSTESCKVVTSDLGYAREELASARSSAKQQEAALATATKKVDGLTAEMANVREDLAAAGGRAAQVAAELIASHTIAAEAAVRGDQLAAELGLAREELAATRAQAAERGKQIQQAESRAENERKHASESEQYAAETRKELALALARVTDLQAVASEVPSLRQRITELEKEPVSGKVSAKATTNG